MRGAVVVCLSLLVACRGDGKISHVSQTWSVTPRFDRGPTRHVLEREFTMPKDFPIHSSNLWITMTDTSGRRFRAKEMSISATGDGVQMPRVSAKFELAEGSKPDWLDIGGVYFVDFSSSRITRRAGPGGP